METTESTDVVKLLEEVDFEKAALHMKCLVGKLGTEDLLYFYGRYKQARKGICTEPKPGFFEFQAKQKWTAWHELGDMPKQTAMREYVDKMDEVDPGWMDKVDLLGEGGEKAWVSVSTPAKEQADRDVDIADEAKTACDWIKEGNVEGVRKSLTDQLVRDFRDENGLGLIHWAADRGVVEIVRLLAETPGLEVNLQDADGQTALHYACSNGHRDVTELLLTLEGIDTTIRDEDGISAVETIDDASADLRQLFHAKTE